MRREISCSLQGPPRVQLATAHGQASGNGAFPHFCAQMCAGGDICWGGPCRSQAQQKRECGSWVTRSWVNLGQYQHASALASASRAGKVETMENTACSINKQARIASTQLFPPLQEISAVYPSIHDFSLPRRVESLCSNKRRPCHQQEGAPSH